MFGVFAISLLNKDFYIYERLVCTWDKKIKQNYYKIIYKLFINYYKNYL